MASVAFFGLLFRDLRNFGKGQRRVGRRFGCGLAHLRDLWELLCKISYHQTKRGPHRRTQKITKIQSPEVNVRRSAFQAAR
jgi:hypothetical protein